MCEELRFEDVSELSNVIMGTLNDGLGLDSGVSVISDFDTIWDVAHWLYEDYSVKIDYVEINTEEYDREYTLSVYEDYGNYYLDIEKSYYEDDDEYLAVDGLVFIDNKANSKILKDFENNNVDFIPVFFNIGEDECKSCCLETEESDHKMVYSVPICFKGIINEFNKIINKYFEEIIME